MKNILLIILICFSGCTLFRKTHKATASNTNSSTNQLESSQLVLKSIDKETQIVTYWNDSGFYQFQHIREQTDQAKIAKLKTEEKQQAKQTNFTKKIEPLNAWIFVVIVVIILVWLFISNKRKAL